MFVVHQDVEGEMAVVCDQRPADFHVAVVAAKQDFAAGARFGVVNALIEVVRIVHGEVAVSEAVLPDGKTVGNGFGKAADLAVNGVFGQLQAGCRALQALLVTGDVASGARAGVVVVAADDADGDGQQPGRQVTHDLGGEPERQAVAAFGLVGPMVLVHGRRSRQRRPLRKRRACMALMRRLSRHRRKCERPSAG